MPKILGRFDWGKTSHRKEGLRIPQLRILRALARSPGPVSCSRIASRASVDPAWVGDHLYGRLDPEARKRREEITGPSLLSLGYVQLLTLDIDGKEELCFSITPSGREALKDL